MAIFSTEFAVHNTVGRADFAAQVIAWVKGMNSSTLFDSETALSQFNDEASISSPSGEMLTLRECEILDGMVIGARHEIPDLEGRIWRSEVTLTSKSGISALRIKTQCIISTDGARFQIPRKPYFIKLAIEDGWPIRDADFEINQKPIYLNERDLELATKIVCGHAPSQLPIVYVSRSDKNLTLLNEKELDNLAFRLGGVAHVVVEPSRSFSKEIMIKSGGKNPYGGFIGICVSNYGVVKRYFLGGLFPESENLFQAIYNFSSQYVTNRKPRLGWDWQDLIEEASRQLRSKVQTGSADVKAWIEAFDQEIQEKDNEIHTLREQVEKIQAENLERSSNESNSIFSQLSNFLGKELYRGEFLDRIRSIIKTFSSDKPLESHKRTTEIANLILENTTWSGGAARLEERIKAAGKDSATADERLSVILVELGYSSRRTGGHPVLTPEGLVGVSSQTMSTSTSDYRAGKNASLRIIRDLGINDLQD